MNPYKVYILKFAWRTAQYGVLKLGDIHDTTPLDLGYFIWVVTNGEHTAVVDTGFTEEACHQRGRSWICDPHERFEAIGIDPATIDTVILSHMHWDHAGNNAMFPKATFVVQDDEMAFWTGRYVKYDHFRGAMDVESVCEMVRLNYDGRMRFVNGVEEVLPGVRVHRLGGHTKGVQVTEVPTASGTVVVCSDAVHTYPNYRDMRPTPIIHNAPEYLEGYDRIRRMARDERFVLPGHDNEQMKNHPNVAEGVALVE